MRIFARKTGAIHPDPCTDFGSTAYPVAIPMSLCDAMLAPLVLGGLKSPAISLTVTRSFFPVGDRFSPLQRSFLKQATRELQAAIVHPFIE